MKHLKLALTLAVVSLLVVPAFSLPNSGARGPGVGICPMSLTDEEMANMTLAELKDMKSNLTSYGPFFRGGLDILLMDLSNEELEGMTVAELKELQQQQTAEMENMTLAEIEDLREQHRTQIESMTLTQIRERQELLGRLGLGGFGGFNGAMDCQGNQGPMGQNGGAGVGHCQMDGPGLMKGPFNGLRDGGR